MKTLPNITTVAELLAYIQAEENAAMKKCPSVSSGYRAVYNWLQDNARISPGVETQTSSELYFTESTGGEASEAALVSQAKAKIYAARATCNQNLEQVDATVAVTPLVEEDVFLPSDAGEGGGIPWWLIAGGIGVAAYLLLKKKPGGQSLVSKAVSRVRRKRA